MSSRDQKRQAYSNMLIPGKTLTTDVNKAGQQICGTCKNYREGAMASDGRGDCSLLKMGSNIASNPPVYNLESKEGYMTKTLSDASACKYYEKMTMIDTDGHECSDPVYRRSMRQLQEN